MEPPTTMDPYAIADWRTCLDCGREFPVTARDLTWYAQNQYVLPKRCLSCRKARRAARTEPAAPPDGFPLGG